MDYKQADPYMRRTMTAKFIENTRQTRNPWRLLSDKVRLARMMLNECLWG